MDGREFMRALLDSKRLNPNALAIKLDNKGLQSQLQRFLKGTTKEPRRDTLQSIADFFGVSVDAFYNQDIADSEAARIGVTMYAASESRNVRQLRSGSSRHELVAALQTLAQNIELVDEASRDALSKKLASLVLAPDSKSLVEAIANQLASGGSAPGGELPESSVASH